VEVELHAFLTSALDGDDQRHAPATLPPEKKRSSLGGSRSLSESGGEKENIFPRQNQALVFRAASDRYLTELSRLTLLLV
jgi:hypothetical protein